MVQKQSRESFGVQPGDQIVIKGIIAFARVDKQIEGAALEAENAKRQKNGMMAATAPFRSLTIENPEIVKGENSPLANFYAQNVYTAKGSGKPSMSFESKSKFPPTYGHIQNGQLVEIADPQKNPAPGQEVYLMINAFKPKNFTKMGSSFNAIVYGEGPIKFYEGGGNGLAGFGEALGMPVASGAPQQTQAENVQPPAQQNAFGNEQTAPQQGGFGNAPVQPQQQNAFGTQQAAQPAFGEQQAPQPQASPFGGGQPQQGGQGSPFDNAGGFGQAQANGRTDSPFA